MVKRTLNMNIPFYTHAYLGFQQLSCKTDAIKPKLNESSFAGPCSDDTFNERWV